MRVAPRRGAGLGLDAMDAFGVDAQDHVTLFAGPLGHLG
jgi:hypothetical protein